MYKKNSLLLIALLPSFLLTSLLGRLQAFPMFEEGGDGRAGENAARNSDWKNNRYSNIPERMEKPSDLNSSDLSRGVGVIEFGETNDASSSASSSQAPSDARGSLDTVSVTHLVGPAQSGQLSSSSLNRSTSFSDLVAQDRRATLARARSEVSALVEEAKSINPAFAAIIDEWHGADPETRAAIINTQILGPGDSHEEAAQRNQIAILLAQVDAMERSIGGASTSILQVPPPGVRAEQTLQNLEQANQITAQAVNDFMRFTRAAKTMTCLSALNFNAFPMPDIISTFVSANQGVDWANIPLILNNSDTPVRLIIPAFAGQSRYTLATPTIIPAGAKTIIENVTTIAPKRIPTAEENQEVRRLINEALQVYYGPEVSRLFPNIDHVDTPIMAGEIADLLSKIEDKYRENEHQNGTLATQYSQIPVSLADALVEHPSLFTSDEVRRREVETRFKRADESLTVSPEKALGRAAYYAGETVARSAAVVGGTIAGIAPKAALAAAIVIAPFLSCAVIGGISGGLLSALGGDPIFNPVFGAVLGVIGGLIPAFEFSNIISTAVVNLFREAGTTARDVATYFAPGSALANAKEALYDWNGTSATRAVEVLQQAQETDQAAITSLNDLFTSFVPVENASDANQAQYHVSASSASSSATVDVAKTELDAGTMSSAPTLTREQVKILLINQIEQRIRDRADFITRLQNKIAAIKAQDEAAKAKANSPAGRLRWGRLP